MESVEPIARLRTLAADRAKTERAELYQAYKAAIADDISLTKAQQQELEERVAEHNKWITQNSARLEALPRVLSSIIAYEQKRDLYRNQIVSVLAEAQQISVNHLWGTRRDGQRDPGAFKAVVGGVKNRLGQARGLAGALHRAFLQIGVELAASEKHGFGLPPEPVPYAENPAPEPEPLKVETKFDPRRARRN